MYRCGGCFVARSPGAEAKACLASQKHRACKFLKLEPRSMMLQRELYDKTRVCSSPIVRYIFAQQ